MTWPVGLMLLALMAGCATTPAEAPVELESQHRLHHLVIIWLKQAGDEEVRQRYIITR